MAEYGSTRQGIEALPSTSAAAEPFRETLTERFGDGGHPNFKLSAQVT